MNLIDGILGEYQHENAVTRRILERVPENHFDFRPHKKSMNLGNLSSHLAEIHTWIPDIVKQSVFVMDPATYKPYKASSRADLLREFDKNVAVATDAMKGMTNEQLLAPWTFQAGGQTVFTLPRIAVLGSFIIKHCVHHRAQLGVYLRLLDIPLPPSYGPTADESGMPANK